MNHKIRYDSLMTNHDYDQGSCYCTDFAIGYLGIINESLVYSHNNDIEFHERILHWNLQRVKAGKTMKVSFRMGKALFFS